jgi:hypothetical protein
VIRLTCFYVSAASIVRISSCSGLCSGIRRCRFPHQWHIETHSRQNVAILTTQQTQTSHRVIKQCVSLRLPLRSSCMMPCDGGLPLGGVLQLVIRQRHRGGHNDAQHAVYDACVPRESGAFVGLVMVRSQILPDRGFLRLSRSQTDRHALGIAQQSLKPGWCRRHLVHSLTRVPLLHHGRKRCCSYTLPI